MTFELAIVIPAFRRAASLERLLRSIARADYPTPPRVIISLEGGAAAAVDAIARGFAERFSSAVVRTHCERLGLRRHILECGDYAFEYEAVILLEDDLCVDCGFYQYAAAAIDFYRANPSIAGVALYAPEYNEFAGVPFEPMVNGYDTYPMRVPCSWGQVWTSEQWRNFRNWYAKADGPQVEGMQRLPLCVRNWPDSSWKKYFAAFMSERELDFIYPYRSLTTNCADADGEHCRSQSELYQVHLGYQNRPSFDLRFDPVAQGRSVAYDEFMEPSGAFVSESLALDEGEFEVDLFGTKPLKLLRQKKYVVTTRPINNPLARYAMRYRPIDQNLFFREAALDNEPCISLASSAGLVDSPSRHSLDEVSFRSGMPLNTVRHCAAAAAALPGLIAKKIVSRYLRTQ